LCAFKQGIINWPGDGSCDLSSGWNCDGGTGDHTAATTYPCGGPDAITWSGVTCGPSGSVSELSLNNCGLKGTIAAREISSSLHDLFQIDLSNNEFVDGFPSELSQLSNLRLLILTSNKLTGAVGDYICRMKDRAYDLNIDGSAFWCVNPCVQYKGNSPVTRSNYCGYQFSLNRPYTLYITIVVSIVFSSGLLVLLFLTKPIFIVLVIFPFLDVFSDLLFIISAEFFTDFIWYICVFFYLLPCMHFIYEMIAVESLIGRSACFKFPLQGNLWWLSSKDGLPMISGEHPSLIKDSWEDLIKIIFVVIPTWILLCMLQLCTWILFFFWTVIFDPMFFFWTGVGMFF
jgi:hypothetical protein